MTRSRATLKAASMPIRPARTEPEPKGCRSRPGLTYDEWAEISPKSSPSDLAAELMPTARDLQARLATARSGEDVDLIRIEWSAICARLHSRYGKSVIPPKEAGGDTAVREAVMDAFDLNFVGDVIREVLKAALKAEGVEVTEAAVEALAATTAKALAEGIGNVLVTRVSIALGLMSRQAGMAYLRRNWAVSEEAFAAVLEKHAIRLTASRRSALVNRVLSKLLDPVLIFPNVTRTVIRKLLGAPLAFLRVYFTPSAVARSSDDVLGGIAGQVEAAFAAARSRVSNGGGAASPVPRGP